MSRNEEISQLGPEDVYSVSDFTTIPIQLNVALDGEMTKVNSDDSVVPLGPIQLAAAVYIVDAEIDSSGHAMLRLSDGTVVTLGKVTASRDVVVTQSGIGQYTQTVGAAMEFTPLKVNYPLVLRDNNLEYLQTNSLKLSQHARLEHRGPALSGRYFTGWTALPIQPIINNLQLPINNQLFTLEPGRYYVRIMGSAYLGDYTYLALIDAATNQPLHDPKIAFTGRTSASGTVLGSQVFNVEVPTTAYFGHRVDTQIGTHEDGRGVNLAMAVDVLYDIYNVAEIWRLDV